MLEVSDLLIDGRPPAPVHLAPWSCRWHLWHRWTTVRVDARTSYVACAACGRLPAPALFEPPVP